MEYCKNILETIGNTPLVRLNSVCREVPATVLAKVETFNPGHSVKDRMALKMIEDAESAGILKPGGTVIEGTSGNTGMGLALACIIKGYKLICTTNDKQSKEKMDILRALGAEVLVCPTNVEPDDPRSYYSVARRLNKEIPNSFYPNQYDNLSNRQAHYESTGPEIWRQCGDKMSHFVVGVGTGGTISGTARYFKEQNQNIKVWGIDSYGSVFKKYHETGVFDKHEIYPYITEGIGEDLLPKNVDFGLIDHFEKVTDKDGAVYARRLAREEGIFVGYSAGSAVAGIVQMKDQLTPDDVVVVLFHDHGSRYVGKIFNDDWMIEHGFMERPKAPELKTAIDLIRRHAHLPLVSIEGSAPVRDAIALLSKYGISQIPVKEGDNIVGALNDTSLYRWLMENSGGQDEAVESIMEDPFPAVEPNDKIESVRQLISTHTAVLVSDGDGRTHIITRQDVLTAME